MEFVRAYHGRLSIEPPFRLDLTVAALRRLPTNRVDVYDGERYLRAFSTGMGPVIWEVRQVDTELEVSLYGQVEEVEDYLKRLERMLGLRVALQPFYTRAAAGPPSLLRLVETFRGVKPPRTASLWETFVNTIPFQQLSLKSQGCGCPGGPPLRLPRRGRHRLLRSLGPYKGMLYYHLLLARGVSV